MWTGRRRARAGSRAQACRVPLLPVQRRLLLEIPPRRRSVGERRAIGEVSSRGLELAASMMALIACCICAGCVSPPLQVAVENLDRFHVGRPWRSGDVRPSASVVLGLSRREARRTVSLARAVCVRKHVCFRVARDLGGQRAFWLPPTGEAVFARQRELDRGEFGLRVLLAQRLENVCLASFLRCSGGRAAAFGCDAQMGSDRVS